ncbi:hypothetical protein WL766_10955 [Staphylococcus pasteuri]|uniref:hypothetical protein n=1 Tax=Staphylococcus pasteuri TaxID=45972 RepID=UPI000AD33894|nr:hypothetical protein [Staphylococcus pasteuri]MCO5361050.1 hypothetical protein [Staphylococcus pasteuri]
MKVGKNSFKTIKDKKSQLPETGSINTGTTRTTNLLILILGLTILKLRRKKKDF